jgi:hypothetical protein
MSEPEPSSGAEPSAQPASATFEDRRAFVRLASDLVSETRPAGGSRDVSWPGKVRDISRGGVGLVMQHRFRAGTRLDIELRDADGVLLRTVRARVVHATAILVDGCPRWLLGCAFHEPLSEDEFDALQ